MAENHLKKYSTSLASMEINSGGSAGSWESYDVPQYPADPVLDIYPKDASSCYRNTCSTMSIAALFIIARH